MPDRCAVPVAARLEEDPYICAASRLRGRSAADEAAVEDAPAAADEVVADELAVDEPGDAPAVDVPADDSQVSAVQDENFLVAPGREGE